MQLRMDTKNFMKQMNNLMQYSYGFLDGIEQGKTTFFHNLGRETIKALELYIDVEARSNQQALHHVYEWYQTGSPQARLFDLKFTVSNLGLSFGNNFKQSKSLSHNATEPFINKALVMESGMQVVIEPKKSDVLAFEINGEQVFTKNPVVVENPGGDAVAVSFEKVFDEFFQYYFKQSFLKASGIFNYLEKPTLYKQNLRNGLKFGRQAGIESGIRWIANARVNEVIV